MSELTPEALAEWDADAESAEGYPGYGRVADHRIRTLIRSLRDEKAAREEAESILKTVTYDKEVHRLNAQRAKVAREDALILRDAAEARAAKAEQERDEAEEQTNRIIRQCNEADRALSDMTRQRDEARVEALADKREEAGPRQRCHVLRCRCRPHDP